MQRTLDYTLWDYQQQFVKDLAVATKEHQHVIGQSPGGTGKTKTFVYIGTQVCNKGGVTLILTERKNVYKQNLDEANAIGINADTPKFIPIVAGGFYVAMTQTLEGRPLIYEQFNKLSEHGVRLYIIIDECHSGRYSNLLNKLNYGARLGFTATPDFRQAKHLPLFYNHCVTTHNVQWFIDNNILCDYQHIQRKSGKATDKLEKKAGEFTAASQRKFFGTEEHYQELFTDLNSATFNKCMVFCASIEHAEEVFIRMTTEGYKCSINHSKRTDSDYQVAMFKELDQTNIIITVGNMTTGFDMPTVDCIVLYRATTSLIIYLQMLFRADRKKEGMFFRVWDYGSNFDRHKAYFHDHPWAKMWKEKIKKKKEDAVTPMILCPQCESMIFVAARICKWCGHEIPVKAVTPEIGIAEDVTNKLEPLKGKLLSQLEPKELALYANLKDKKALAARVARALEQDKEGYLKLYGKAMGYKQNWAYIQRDMGGDLQFQDLRI
jgi:superfamily II DNA or RNA helicase